MIFLNSIWLYLTPLLVIGISSLIFYGMRRRETLLSNFAAARLLDQLTDEVQNKRLWIKAGCIVMGITLLGITLARPQYGIEWIERKARGLDIIFVLDSSKSMLATDLRPTRLDRAKLAVIDLVERLESDRIGLVAFAGRAFLQTPPTLDYSAFGESLDSIRTDTITSGGSDLGGAITEAANAFPQANNFKVVILLTDGEDLGGTAIEVAKKVADKNVKIYAIGLGTPEGEYLRIRNEKGEEAFIRDSAGQPVRSQLDETTLSEIARLTGGSYARLGSDSLDALYTSVIATLPREERESEMQEARIDRYQWPLGIALLFLTAEFVIRRRSRSTVVALTLITTLSLLPKQSQAQEIELPVEPEKNETAGAVETEDARKLYNTAHDLLEKGKYIDAKATFDQSIQRSTDFSLQRDSIYNSAHSVFQEGEAAYQAQKFEEAIEKWKEAEELFKSAHSIDPVDEEALEDAALVETRRKALEKFLEQQQQNQDQQSDGEQGEENSDQQQEPQEGDSEGEQSNQEQQDQEQSGENGEQENDSSPQDNESQGDQNSDQNASQDQSEENNEESQSPAENDEEETDEPQESTSNEEEGEEQSPGAESEEEPSEPTEEGQTGEAASESGEDDAQSESNTAAGDAVEFEGMSPEQAAALLDSLREGERLLPFMEQLPPSKKSKKSEDW